jgi:cytochrome c biogenesis protein CcmG/thiol:disulfide interchange protein DsbE
VRLRLVLVTALVVLSALLLSGCSDGAARPGRPKADDRLPDLTLAGFDGGQPVDLSTLRGPLVINLWASWCGPCRAELPKYQAFAKKYAGKVDVLGIDFQETRADRARDLVRDTGVDYPLALDPDGKLRAVGLPKVILLDEDGRISYQEYVEITSVDQLEDLVTEHLGVS